MERFKLNIRLGSSIDSKKICLLFKNVIPEYDREINFWVWINRMLSDTNSIIAIAEYNGEIIGHYAIIPQKIIIDDTEYSIGLGVHALIQSDKNDLVSIYEISNLAYKEAKRIGIQFVYGFPNKNYRLIQEKIERWEKIKIFNSYEFNINNYKSKSIINVKKIKRLDATYKSFHKISQVIEKGQIDSRFSFKKSLNYFCNRYLNHPHNLYESFLVSDNHENKACLVLKIYLDNKTGLSKGHLIDFIKPKEFNMKTLLNISVSILNERNVNIFSFWPINSEVMNLFNTMKIEASGFDTFFGIKFLDKIFKRKYKKELLNFKNWTLQMGDSDAF